MNTTPIGHPMSRAWGQTFAATPPLQELRDRAQAELDAGVPESEVRTHLVGWARQSGLVSVRAALGIPRKVARLPFAKMLVALAKHYAHRTRHRTVSDWLESFAAPLALDEWFADFVLGWVRTGEPGPVYGAFRGGVTTVRVGPPDDTMPLVFAVAGPTSDPYELAAAFLDECSRSFPAAVWTRSENPHTVARYLRLFAEGLSDRQIAAQELEGRYFVDDDERRSELRLATQRVKKARLRWLKRVTQTLDSVSPDSEGS